MNTKVVKQNKLKQQELKQYQFLKSEIDDLNRRIKKLKADSITQDVVSASSGPPSYAKNRITISGAEISSSKKLKRLEMMLTEKKAELTEKLFEIEIEIQSIDDSRVRQIIRYKYIDGMNFIQVARKMGGNNSVSAIKMTLKRYFESCDFCDD